MEGMSDLNSHSTFSKARLGVWNLGRMASRRVVLPYRNLSVLTLLFSVALVALWTWDILWDLAKHPTKDEGRVLQEDKMYQPHP